MGERQVSSSVIDHPYREFERSGWEQAAAAYGDTFEAATKLFAPALLESVDIHDGSKLLDVACGTGHVAAMAALRGADVTAVDFSPNMIAEGKKRHPSLRFQEADAEALPFPEETFDAVVINQGIQHFPFPVRALSEARRVLRGGGRLAFTTWAPPAEHLVQKIIIDAVREAGVTGAGLPLPPGGAVNETSICARLLKDSGFENGAVRVETVTNYLLINSAQQFIDMLSAGTVRQSMMLRSQPIEKAAVILAAVEKAISPYRDEAHFRLRAVAILGVGTK